MRSIAWRARSTGPVTPSARKRVAPSILEHRLVLFMKDGPKTREAAWIVPVPRGASLVQHDASGSPDGIWPINTVASIVPPAAAGQHGNSSQRRVPPILTRPRSDRRAAWFPSDTLRDCPAHGV